MATPHRSPARRAGDPRAVSGPTGSSTVARPGGASRREMPLTRRYEMRCLLPDGRLEEFARTGPATPVFEDAFAAFARGALISTAHGPVAVEDLTPGSLVETAAHGPQPLLWVGAITLFPDPGPTPGGEGARLTRLATDAFGLGRPMPDLVLGPRARVLYRHARCREILGPGEGTGEGTGAAFAPAHAFADGVSVTELRPASPVRVYHLAFRGQQIVLANGVEVESYHPGPGIDALLTPAMRTAFLDLFPCFDDFHGFGPMDTPRLTAFEVDTLRAA